jgi:hypothetical protein
VYQANNLGNAYIFIISCINLAQVDQMKTHKSTEHIGQKLSDVLKALKVTVEGPIWNEILQMANKKLVVLQESVINRNFIKELKPMLTLTKALCWESIGSGLLSRVNLVNIIKIHGKSALR